MVVIPFNLHNPIIASKVIELLRPRSSDRYITDIFHKADKQNIKHIVSKMSESELVITVHQLTEGGLSFSEVVDLLHLRDLSKRKFNKLIREINKVQLCVDVPSLIVLGILLYIIKLITGGFFQQAGVDAWQVFKKKLAQVLVKTEKKDVPTLVVRMTIESTEIRAYLKSNDQRIVFQFMEDAIPMLSQICMEIRNKTTPKEFWKVFLEYNPNKMRFGKVKAIDKQLKLRYVYSFAKKGWQIDLNG